MAFYDLYLQYENFDFVSFCQNISIRDLEKILRKERLSHFDFLALLSEKASPLLGEIGKKAKTVTRRNFGRTISLYSPLYLSNYCSNECIYCGFKKSAHIKRHRLDSEELATEAAAIAGSGIKHVLVLTGESRKISPPSYIKGCIEILNQHFPHISMEIYPLEISEYRELVDSGAEGLTLYQETYDRRLYSEYHLQGSKSDFAYRLAAPERAAEAGMRSINVGALLGLCEFRKDVFFTGLHADFLMRRYPAVEVGMSVPRIDQEGGFRPPCVVSDENLLQIISALRLFLPSAGISLSTRERPSLRDSLVESGITRISAGSKTEVGGYSLSKKTAPQFDTNDNRSVAEITAMISSKTYDPVFTEWRRI